MPLWPKGQLSAQEKIRVVFLSVIWGDLNFRNGFSSLGFEMEGDKKIFHEH